MEEEEGTEIPAPGDDESESQSEPEPPADESSRESEQDPPESPIDAVNTEPLYDELGVRIMEAFEWHMDQDEDSSGNVHNVMVFPIEDPIDEPFFNILPSPTTSGDEDDRDQEISFDTNLPAEHTYLGENMNRVSGVEYLEVGRMHRLMLFLHQHIVYPGEVIPFMIPAYIIEPDIDSDNGLLFGLVFAHVRCPKTQAMYGVTCQIYEKGTDERGNTLIKSRALQRFITTNETKRDQLEYITSAPQLRAFGNVKILPEVYLPEPLSVINLGSMNRFRDLPGMGLYMKSFQSATTTWPTYVFKQYNIYKLTENVIRTLESQKLDAMPKDPIRLSFWLSRNSHFSENELKRIFMTDSVNLRMKMIALSFHDGGFFSCRFCRLYIAHCSELFAMSKTGVQSQYCNSAGYIHETNTVYKVFTNSVVLSGQSSSEFSWFPGYEWQIMICKMCNHHLGWQFRAVLPNLSPPLFFGITGASVRIERETQGVDF